MKKLNAILLLCAFSSIIMCVSGCKRAKLYEKNQENLAGIPNPVKESSAEEILASLGFSFNVPADAKDVTYSIISGTLAQAMFLWNGSDCVVRAEMTGELEPKDISGCYYDWQETSSAKIGYNDATVKIFTSDSESVGICIWVDKVPGIEYSVSMKPNTSKEKLAELANLIYVPMQGEN